MVFCFPVRVLTVMVSLSVACITDDDDDDGILLYDDGPFCEGNVRRVVDPATGGE